MAKADIIRNSEISRNLLEVPVWVKNTRHASINWFKQRHS